MPAFVDLTNGRFGRLLVLEGARRHGRWYWKCKCDCGNETEVEARNLTRSTGKTTSCGCFARERAAEIGKAGATHGHSANGKRSRVYRIWQGMMERCYRMSNKKFLDYGGRGIYVDQRWHTFENFLLDMGEPPAGKTLERRNNDKNYSKRNCHWATQAEQTLNTRRNRRIRFNGETKVLSVWCRDLGLDYHKTHSRLTRLGWSVERAFTTA